MIYIDITNTNVANGLTGIQRVVSELVWRFAELLPEVVFISFDRIKGQYCRLLVTCLPPPPYFVKDISLEDDLLFNDFCPGDLFIEIDAAWGDPLDRYSLLTKLKSVGVIVVCMHYDAVPVLFPDFSHPNTVYRYGGYLAAHLDLADYFVCISDTVKNDLMELALILTRRKVTAFTLPLGADFIRPVVSTHKKKHSNHKIIDKLIKEKFILAVGTLEPRKNHCMLLLAYDLIDKNIHLNLVIVGKKGWNVDTLAATIRKRPDFGKRVFWLESVNDRELSQLYENTFISVNASHYEGYGLPVIESLAHNCVTVCCRGGAMEEVAGESCCVLTENTAQCLAENIDELTHNQLTYEHYKELAKNFQAPTWDDSCQHFIDILEHIQKAKEFNWGFVPRQAVYISIDADQMFYSLQSVLQNMTFIEEVILLTAERCKEDMVAVLEATGKRYTILTDEDIFNKIQVDADDFKDHQLRNTFLRRILFQHETIDANFISFDDDYLVQKKVEPDFYLKDEVHSGYKFYDNACEWLGSPASATSYDAGIWRTGSTLESCGYKSNCFSSHMPQIINKKLAAVIYERMVPLQAEAMDEWSLYFNIFSHLYPSHCKIRNYAAVSWPCNPTDWIPTELPGNCYFENYYKWNYEKGGRFYNLQIIGDFPEKISRWQKAFERQLEQRDLNLRQFGYDNPRIELYKDSMKVDFTTCEVLENELLRITLVKRTDFIGDDVRLTARLLAKGKLLGESSVNVLLARWVPIVVKYSSASITLELLYQDIKSKRLIDHKAMKIKFVKKVSN